MAGKRTPIVPKSRRPERVEETRTETQSYLDNLPRVISRIGKVDENELSTFRSERQRNSESLNAQIDQPSTSEVVETQLAQNFDTKSSDAKSAIDIVDSAQVKSTNQPRSTLGRVKQHFASLRAELASSDSKNERQSTYHRVIATVVASLLVLVTVGIALQMKYRANRRSNATTIANKTTPAAVSDSTLRKLANVKPKTSGQSSSANLSKVAASKSETSLKTGSPPKIYGGSVFIPSLDQTPVASLPPLPNYLQSNPSSQIGNPSGNYSQAGYSNALANNPAPFPSSQVSAMQQRNSNQLPMIRNDNPNVMQQTNPYASQIPQMAMQPPASQNIPAVVAMPIANGNPAQPAANQFQDNNGLFQQGSPVIIAQQQNVRAIPTGNQFQPNQAGGPVTYAPNGDVRLDGGIESVPFRR